MLSFRIAQASPGLLNLHAWLLWALVFVRGLAGLEGHGLPGPLFWLSRGLLLTRGHGLPGPLFWLSRGLLLTRGHGLPGPLFWLSRGLLLTRGHGLPGPLFWLSRGLLLTLVPLASLVPGRPGGSLLPLLYSSC